MIVWLNADGSVGEIVSSYVLTDEDSGKHTAFSQREGNLAAGGIFVYFDGGNPSGGLAYSAWELPTGEVSPTALKASWEKKCVIAFDKARDMRKFKAETEYLMQYFPFPDGLISEGGNGVYKVGITDSIDGKTYAYGPVLFSVAENAVVKETTITKTEYSELKADVESKADKATLSNYQLQFSPSNVRGYSSYDDAVADLGNLAVGQYAVVEQDAYLVAQSDDGKALEPVPLGKTALRDYYVFKSGDAELQDVFTGLASYYENANGDTMNYGTRGGETEGMGFFAHVLDDNAFPVGKIDFTAKSYAFKGKDYGTVFSSADGVTKVSNSSETASLELSTGEADLKANTIKFAGGAVDVAGTKFIVNTPYNSFAGSVDVEGVFSVALGTIKSIYATASYTMIGDPSGTNKITFTEGATNMEGTLYFKGASYFLEPVNVNAPMNINGNAFYKGAVTDTYHVANKLYVDTADSGLQSQIDAINASQNFVATYATEKDLPSSPTGLDADDCVLILQDSAHENQSTVYKWNGSGWDFVGELGDCYTKSATDALLAEKVSLDADETISGKKTFSEPVVADEIDNTSGSSLLRHASSKTVLGNASAPSVIVGNANRPSYSKSNADLTGSEIALVSDIPTTGAGYTIDALLATTDKLKYVPSWMFESDVCFFGPFKATSLSSAFKDNTYLTAVRSLPDTSKVTNVADMFRDCSSLTEVVLFDTSKVTNMSSMFRSCSSLTSVPLFDTSKVMDMASMFRSCSSLTSVPLFDTSKVMDMESTFFGCSSLTSVPLLDTGNVTVFYNTFSGCSKLTSLPLLNTSKATTMLYMLNGCSSLTSVPAFDTSKATNMSSMFYGCSSLTAIHMTGMKVSFDISASTKFTEEALVEIIGNLATVTSTQTLTMGSTNLAKLTDDEKAVATNKGWTLK